MSVGDWPFLFKDLNHSKKVFNGSIGTEIPSDIEAKHG
jgi:TRAP-type C4-dicarboxylate transport system substrate-binding protein